MGSIGEPSVREIARRTGLSPNAVSMFELGKSPLSTESMRKYAAALRPRSTLAEVRRRWLLSRLDYHEKHARRMRSLLRQIGVSGKRSGRKVHGDRLLKPSKNRP